MNSGLASARRAESLRDLFADMSNAWDYETAWWSLRLPEGYVGRSERGFVRVSAPNLSGELQLECLKKGMGAATRADLRDHCADGGSGRVAPSEIHKGAFRGCFVSGERVDRWAFSRSGSNKILLVRFLKNTSRDDAEAEVETLLGCVVLK